VLAARHTAPPPPGAPFESKAAASRIRGCYRASGRIGFANPKREPTGELRPC